MANEKKFDITLSLTGHKSKAEVKLNWLHYRKQNITIEELTQYIRQGYVISSNFTTDYTTEITQTNRNYGSFINTSIIMVDIDDSNIPMPEFISGLKNIPTIAYTTFSNGVEGKGFRYRLLYVFDTIITSAHTYKALYDAIILNNNIELKDNCGKNLCQAIIGTNNNALIHIGATHSVSDFNLTYNNKIQKCKVNSIRKKEKKHYRNEIALSNEEYVNDYWNLSLKELVEKYNSIYPFFQHTPLPEVDSSTPYIVLPDNYIEIKRYWFDNKIVNDAGEIVGRHSTVRRIKNGEGRKKKLFLNGILRRFMIENLPFEHLLQSLVNELYFYIANKEDIIDKKMLYGIACNAFSADLNHYDSLGSKKDKREYIINPEYCKQHNLNKKQVLAMTKKMINYNKIGELYDCSLTDKENLIIFENYGLKISLRTLKNWRKENSIMKYNKTSQKCKVNSIRKKERKHYKNEIALSNEEVDEKSLYEQTLDYIVPNIQKMCDLSIYNEKGLAAYQVVNDLEGKANRLMRYVKSQDLELEDKEYMCQYIKHITDAIVADAKAA